MKQNQINELIVTDFTTDNGIKQTMTGVERLEHQAEVAADATLARKSQHQEALKNVKYVTTTKKLLSQTTK